VKAINKQATKVFEKLTAGLAVGESRKIDKAPGSYMAIEILRRTETHYTIGHYYEQNGDRVQDPEVDFTVRPDGNPGGIAVIPTAVWHAIGVRQVVAEVERGVFYPRPQRDLASFVGVWFRNIKEQQGF
jgi:hypothetical protein